MKIGITIPDYYKGFLEETAKINNMTITKICSIIATNYLSYNKQKNRLPIFAPSYNVLYANKQNKQIVTEEDKVVEEYKEVSWDDMMKEIEKTPKIY